MGQNPFTTKNVVLIVCSCRWGEVSKAAEAPHQSIVRQNAGLWLTIGSSALDTSMKDSTTSALFETNKRQDSGVKPLNLGTKLRQMRQQKGWTLDEMSARSGLAKSTLSKIENDKLSPSFEVIQKLTTGLDIDVPQLFVESSHHEAGGRRSITLAGAGKPHPTPTYEHELLNTDLTSKRMVPFKTVVKARSFDEYGDWVRHAGEEFLYVLSGSLVFYSEYYEPVMLDAGDSIYYDCGMGHALITTSEEDAEALWVCAPN